jgi:hypothetical protein
MGIIFAPIIALLEFLSFKGEKTPQTQSNTENLIVPIEP